MSDITITLDYGLQERLAPLYHRYPRQSNPQPAYVRLDETWGVVPAITGRALASLLQRDDVRALLQRVHDGHSVEWDGSNHIGRLDGGAQDASYDLDRIFGDIDPSDCAAIWTADDWLSPNGLDNWPAEMTLDEAAAEAEAAALAEGVYLDTEVKPTLLEIAQRAHGRGESLSATQLAALVEAGMVDEEV